MELNAIYPRQKLINIIIIGYFLLFFFSYFYFFITSNAISGKAISEQEQLNINFNKPTINFELNTSKVIAFFALTGGALLIIGVVFFFSKPLHRKITKEQKIIRKYSPFNSLN